MTAINSLGFSQPALSISLSNAWDEELAEASQLESRPKYLPSTAQCEEWLRAGLALLEQTVPYALSLRAATSGESAALNARYRGRENATNVLSFPVINHAEEDQQWLPPSLVGLSGPDTDHDANPEQQLEMLGDLVFCPSVIAAEALTQEKSLEQHWAHLVLHGLFHLLGYDHLNENEAREMEALEIDALQSLGINNPYLID